MFYGIPFHANVDLPFVHAMEEALHKSSPLQSQGSDQEVEAHAAEAIALKEGHEEAETDEDHHMNILELRVQTPVERRRFMNEKKIIT